MLGVNLGELLAARVVSAMKNEKIVFLTMLYVLKTRGLQNSPSTNFFGFSKIHF